MQGPAGAKLAKGGRKVVVKYVGRLKSSGKVRPAVPAAWQSTWAVVWYVGRLKSRGQVTGAAWNCTSSLVWP